jgi:hypothetical protein
MSSELRLDQQPAPRKENSLPTEVDAQPGLNSAPAGKLAKSSRSRRVPWKILPGALTAGVVVASVAAAFLRYFDDFPAAANLPQAAARYKALNLPLNASELDPKIPAEENAAPYLQKARDQIMGTLQATQNVGKLLQQHQYRSADQLASLLDPAIGTAAYAVTKPRLSYGRDWDRGPMTLYPETANAKILIRAIASRAETLAATGNSQGAAKDILVGREIAGLEGQEPMWLGAYISFSCDSVIYHGASESAAFLANDLSGLQSLRQALAKPVGEPTIANALRGEAYNEVAFARNPILQDPKLFPNRGIFSESALEVDFSRLQRQGLPTSLHARAVLDRVMTFWSDVAEFEKSHPNDPLEMTRKLRALGQELTSHHTSSYDSLDLTHSFYANLGERWLRRQADLAVTQAFVEAMIFHAKHGVFPHAIGDLPGSWIDPFTGRPLTLSNLHGGISISCPVPDQFKSNQMSERENDFLYEDEPDIVASYPLPK